MEYQGIRTQIMTQFGADDHYMEIQGGQLLGGRFFSPAELNGGAPVIVLEHKPAEKLFGRVNPLGRYVRLAGKSLRVIGLYQTPDNIFQPPSQEIGAILPFETARRFYRYDETNALWLVVKPKDGVAVTQAMDAVTVQLRRMRGLRPGDPDTFRPDHAGPDPRRVQQADGGILPRDARALERGPAGGRHRRHGDHDGLRDRPHARDRRPQGPGGHAARNPVAVPGRGGDTYVDGRRARHPARALDGRAAQGGAPVRGAGAGVERRGRVRGLDRDRADLRSGPGRARRQAGSGRGVAIRITEERSP